MRPNYKSPAGSLNGRLFVSLTIVCGLWMMQSPVAAYQESEPPNSDIVTVRFVVQLTQKASTQQNLFVAGNHRTLGNWRADGLALVRNEQSVYTAQVQVQVGTQLEFKFTQGSWATVEKSSEGREISNRTVIAQAGLSSDLQLVHAKVEAWSDSRHSLSSSVTGQLDLHRDVEAPGLNLPRHVAVWLPPKYQESNQRYPVLYLHDGQNLFDQATAAFGVEWHADETATELIQQEMLSPVILVGIWNTSDRLDEYAPTVDAELQRGGKADDYIRCLVAVIKPLIDANYRTKPEREYTAIGGSSLGGLVSLYACMQYNETFSACMVMSPSLGWDQESLLKELERDSIQLPPCTIWLDMGTREGSMPETHAANVQRARRLAKVLDRSRQTRARYLEVPEGMHNEAAWAHRLGLALQFLYGQ